MVLVSNKPMNFIVLNALIVMVMHFLVVYLQPAANSRHLKTG